MILQALVEYYDRLAQDPSSGIAPLGWENKAIGWIIVVDNEGNPVRLESTYEGTGKERKAKVFRVPQGDVRTSGIRAFLLWDNPEYILAVPKEGSKKPQEAVLKAKAFRDRIAGLKLESLKPILDFLDTNPAQRLEACDPSAYAAMRKDAQANLTFKLKDDWDPVTLREDVIAAYEASRKTETHATARCLVSGEPCTPVLVAGKVLLPGGTTSGCSLVAFQKGSGFDSYGKEQGQNAPISAEVSNKYTMALKALLDKQSHNKFSLGDDTVVFWASKSGTFEKDFSAMMFSAEPNETSAEVLRAIRSAPTYGQWRGAEESKGTFYVLGLQPNAARIAVRFWVEQTVEEAAANVKAYFEDLEIVRKDPDQPLPMRMLLRALAPRGDLKALPSRLGGDLLFAALQGRQFPIIIAQTVVRRLHVDAMTSSHIALLKAWLIRYQNVTQSTERKPTVMLDPENTNIGYCLGRLFAVLDKSQQEALKSVNASIKDKFYATASADPASVFGTLLRNNVHHIHKLESRGEYFEKLKGEIFNCIDDIPSHLDLADQARFAIGYYHQTQVFFTPKNKSQE